MRQVLMAALVMFLIQPVVYADQAGTGSGGNYISVGLATSSASEWSWTNTSGSVYHVNSSQNDGTVERIAYGHRFSAFRGEIEYSTVQFDFNRFNYDVSPYTKTASGNEKRTTFFLNAYYDFHSSPKFSPYVGVGIGQTRISWDMRVSTGSVNDSDTVMAYQGIIGLNYSISPQWGVGIEYRRVMTNDILLTDSSGYKQDSIASKDLDSYGVNLAYRF